MGANVSSSALGRAGVSSLCECLTSKHECVCVCVCEREREREREKGRQRQRETDRERGRLWDLKEQYFTKCVAFLRVQNREGCDFFSLTVV